MVLLQHHGRDKLRLFKLIQYDVWQELVFNFSAQSAATNYSRIVVQFNSENNNETVVAYIDDFVMNKQIALILHQLLLRYLMITLKEQETLLGQAFATSGSNDAGFGAQ